MIELKGGRSFFVFFVEYFKKNTCYNCLKNKNRSFEKMKSEEMKARKAVRTSLQKQFCFRAYSSNEEMK